MAAADEALRRVFSNDPELTSLNWSRAAVGDDSVCLLAEALAKGVNTHLRSLDLRGCTRISDASACKLLQALPNCSLVHVAVARTSISAPKRLELQRHCAGNQRAADEAAAIKIPTGDLPQLIASMQAQDSEAAAALRNRDMLEARIAELECGEQPELVSGGQPVMEAGASTPEMQRRLETEVASHAATMTELEQARRSLQHANERAEKLAAENKEKDETIDRLIKKLASTGAVSDQEIASLIETSVPREEHHGDTTPSATKKPPPPESKPPSPPLLTQPKLEPEAELESQPEPRAIDPLTVDARRTFDAIDSDGSGSISCVELNELARKMEASGHDPRPLRSILTQLDVDRSGEIEYDEWQHLWTHLSSFCSQQVRITPAIKAVSFAALPCRGCLFIHVVAARRPLCSRA
eukprot:COSAG02_NODE_870_length_16337_cov_45.593608_3_plen_411_part_00